MTRYVRYTPHSVLLMLVLTTNAMSTDTQIVYKSAIVFFIEKDASFCVEYVGFSITKSRDKKKKVA